MLIFFCVFLLAVMHLSVPVQSVARNDLYVVIERVVNILRGSRPLAHVPLARVQLEILATVSEAEKAERSIPAPWHGWLRVQ